MRFDEDMMRVAGWFLIVSLICSSANAAENSIADEEIKEPSSRSVRYHETHVINADGADTVTRETAVQVLRENAVDYLKHASISFSTSIEKGEIIAAYTQKPNGRKIDVAPTSYQLEVNSGRSKDLPPAFSDNTTLSVVFPDVAVNDILVLQVKITQSEPMFPGQFSDVSTFSRARIYDDVKITYDYPAALPVRFAATQMAETTTPEKDGRRSVTWTFKNEKPVKSKRDGASVYVYGQEPGYMITTFASYEAIAAAYGQRATPKAAVTPRVQKLANEITTGKTTPKEQAAALYDWVTENISYAGNCIGVGAVVPRDLDVVLDNKMGDCKDHATLLQALLQAKAIASTQVLVNAGNVYELPKLPVASMVNHVLNFIPSLNIFIDGTADSYPYGVIPATLAGKTVLSVTDYKDGMTIPLPPKLADRQVTHVNIAIKEDGSAEGTVALQTYGRSALPYYSGFKKMTPTEKQEMEKAYLKPYSMEGTVSVDNTAKDNGSERYELNIKFAVKKFLELGNAGGMPIYPFLARPMLHEIIAYTADFEESTHDFSCADGVVEEYYTYDFPPKVQILAVPKNFSTKTDTLEYAATYKQDKNRVTISRVYKDYSPRPVCPAAMIAPSKEAAKKIMPDLKAQILYTLSE